MLEPPVPRDAIPALLAAADVLLSATQPEASETLDKVVYEAARRRRAGAVEQRRSRRVPRRPAGPAPVRRDVIPDDLARALLEIDAAGPEVRAAVGEELRRRVEAGHSVESWADAVLRELGLVRGGPRQRHEG